MAMPAPMDMSVLQLAVVSLVLACASVYDVRERRVPNWLSYGAVLAGFGYQLAAGAASAALLGVLMCGCLGVLMYALSRLGAGDAKLLMAVGAWLGPGVGLDVTLLTLVTGAAVGCILLLRAGRALQMARELWLSVLTLTTNGARTWIPDGALSFPLAPVMAASWLIVALVPELRPVSPLLEALR